ncbi:hypothetical protein J4E90_008399 [Alternaria incomplexa]|uniref:uncharacterized protein n=1 Tax=Alternaria incomplexa TaxID=1187928 RepID=UPI00221E8E8D|nr:uncharacterized protein J4E90_008399 [Alternaria incomplexa]XP_051296871.1 uncharacterized protein J4E86_011483 [Alternaria arbusti]KAI4908667.1 hypothetical protein J4E90_008399 [Alternaria incomplexa]KAI4934101.1 hypothetical protein J4E86_011483 [Alternaria arbusti]
MPATFTDLLSAFIAITITILATIAVQAKADGNSYALIMHKVKTALVILLPNFAVLLMVCCLVPGVLRQDD